MRFSPNYLILCLLFTLITSTLSAQKTLTFQPKINDSTPNWARLMYQEHPNVWEVDAAYNIFYQQNPFEKNTHTQYYKKWRRTIEPYITEQGFVEMPSLEAIRNEEEKYRSLYKQTPAQEKNQLPWQSLGPFETYSTEPILEPVSWQVNVYTIDQSQSDPNILYCGTEAGGIFKTTDKGLSWQFVSANTLIRTVVTIKIHPTDPDIVYAADSYAIYKTTDGGLNWETLYEQQGLSATDISINPDDTDIILLSSFIGLYRSTDAGQNWTQIISEKCYDIEIKPDDANIVYLLKRNPDENICEFYKSEDSGSTFSIRQNGWYNSTDPDRRDDGARMTVTPADPDRIYVVLAGNSKAGDNGFIGIFRSDTAGESWTLPNPPAGGPYTAAHPNLMTLSNTNTLYQGFYNLGIAAAHDNPDNVLIGGLNLWKTEDGAATFTALGGYQGNIGYIHPDQQEIEINGNDMWVANDGGINYSTDLFSTHESRKFGVIGSDFWGFGAGWNEDILVGGRYHNGNTAYKQAYANGSFRRLGGAEAATGYVNPGIDSKAYFSDISSKIIPNTLDGEIISLPSLNLYPNETFYAAHSSELEFDPRYYKTIYLGKDNQLWKSTDEGVSFELLYTFGTSGNPLLHFEISRSNPDVIYVYQRTSFYGATLWKSSDGGQNWVEKVFPAASSQRAGTMSLSATDENTLWVAFGHQNNNGQKIYKTTDGGDSWENLSTAILDDQTIHHVFHQAGTDGAIYIGTNYAVFYRDNAMNDWMLFNEGLPMRSVCNTFKPFYKEGKLRMATYGNGLWETGFQTTSAPLAQPMVDKAVSFCSRDTFYFDDYSILNHSSASWAWSFPGAAYVSDPSIRNPKVVYSVPGSYSVSLTITQGNGQSSSKTIENMVSITAECEPDTIPGLALDLAGGASDYGSIPALNLNSNTLTFSTWIKRNGDQNAWAGLVFSRAGSTVAGLNLGENNELRYHWNGSEWWWNSGLIVPDNEWAHVALVVEPEKATIYLNGVAAVNAVSHVVEEFDGELRFGADAHSGPRRFKGQMDEICIWDRALSLEEIWAFRHLTKKPQTDDSLIAYYQFNRLNGQATDRVGVRHANLGGSASRITSTSPVGGGLSEQKTILSGGNYDFDEVDMNLTFPANGIQPNGEVVISRINLSPNILPGEHQHSQAYWVINNYGNNAAFTMLDSLSLSQIGQITEEEAEQADLFHLFKRGDNSDDEWEEIGLAVDAIAGTTESEVIFAEEVPITNSSQVFISIDSLMISPVIEEYLPSAYQVYPNPLDMEELLQIRTEEQHNFNFKLFDSTGKLVFSKELIGRSSLALPKLASGNYWYRIEESKRMFTGKLILH